MYWTAYLLKQYGNWQTVGVHEIYFKNKTPGSRLQVALIEVRDAHQAAYIVQFYHNNKTKSLSDGNPIKTNNPCSFSSEHKLFTEKFPVTYGFD